MRHKRSSHPERVTEAVIDGLLGDCKPREVVTEEFARHRRDQLHRIDQERQRQAIAGYTIGEARFFIRTAALAALLNKNDTRDSGEPEFCHPEATVNHLIEVVGRTSCAVLGGGWHHDTPEDKAYLGGDRLERLILSNLPNGGTEYDKRCARIVCRLGNSLTKIRHGAKGDDARTIMKILNAMRSQGIAVAQIKCSDRLHSVRTIHTLQLHKGDLVGCGNLDPGAVMRLTMEKRRGKAEETHNIFGGLARKLGMTEMHRRITDCCVDVINPNLHAGFERLQFDALVPDLDARLEETFLPGGNRTKAENEFLRKKIVEWKYHPLPLSQFVALVDKPLDEIEVEDLPINMSTPLHEVKVLVTPKTDVRDVVLHISKQFAEPGDQVESSEDPHPQRGTILNIYARRYGVIRFRINNTVDEARSKRGGYSKYAHDRHDDDLDEPTKGTLTRIFRDAEGNANRVVELSNERLLRPMITVYVYTAPGQFERVEIVNGATVLDAAAAVGGDHLLALESASRCENEKKGKIGIFDFVHHNMVLELHSGSDIKVDPGWREFCATDGAKDIISGYLAGKTESDEPIDAAARRGEEYVSRLEKSFDINPGALIDLILKKRKGAVSDQPDARQQILFQIGQGRFDVLRFVSEEFFQSQRKVKFRVSLPNVPGELKKFLMDFDRERINVEVLNQLSAAGGSELEYRMIVKDTIDGKSHRLIKTLLKLSYYFRISVEREPDTAQLELPATSST